MKIIKISMSLLLLLSCLAFAQTGETLKDEYLQAAGISGGDRGALNAKLRSVVDSVGDKHLTGEDLFYAGSMAARIRRFDKAATWLEKYFAEPGKNGPIALATLIYVKYWQKDFDTSCEFYATFNERFADSSVGDPLYGGRPIKVIAEISNAKSLLALGKRDEYVQSLKRAIDTIGNNEKGYVPDGELVNYHSWYASNLEGKYGWEKAVEYFETTALPIFKDKPAYNAKIRDRILFARLNHYIATEQYGKGLAELEATVETFKVDDVSYRRVNKVLGRFRLYNKPAPELEYQAWIHGEPTTLKKLRDQVVLLYFFWSG